MKLNIPYFLLIVITVLLISSCNSSNGEFTAKPVALGKRNKITVIADKNLWNGAIQDSFNYYFGASYPIMPQPEPIFDLRYFSVEDLSAEPLRKNLRTYVVLSNLADTNSPATKMLIKDLGEEKYKLALNGQGSMVSAGVDKWANKQLIVYLYGKNETELAKSIKENFTKVAKRINQHDQAQLHATTYALKTNYYHNNLVLENYGIKMKIPSDYKIAKHDSIRNVVWFRKDAKVDRRLAILNLIIQKEKYTDKKQFSKAYIISKRNKFGKMYVSSGEENSYMTTNVVDLPIYEYDQTYGNMQTKEIRGIWEMVNDFVGGPYISYAMYNKEKGEIIYIDCFVMHTGKDKRDLMQQMEYIIKSMEGVNL